MPIAGHERAAMLLLEQFGVRHPQHIRIEDIAWHLGVELIEGELEGCAAQLSLFESRARIRIPRGVDRGRLRFTIAHELGHLQLHQRRMAVCSEADLDAWRADRDKEQDANRFAASLLLPRTLVLPLIDVDEVTFKPIRSLAEAFETSLTATAIRFIELTAHPCALVYARNGQISWTKKSDDFWPRFHPKGEHVSKESLARASLNADPEAAEVPAICWLDGERLPANATVVEDVIQMPRQQATLSLLWLDGIEAPEDEEG